MKFDFSKYIEITGKSYDKNGYYQHGLCPFHSDNRPSFSGNTWTGKWLCFAGCGRGTFEQLVVFLKLQIRRCPPNLGVKEKGSDCSPIDWTKYRLTATYVYTDFRGIPKLRVKRFESIGSGKTFLQEHRNQSGIWVRGGTEDPLAPYRFHDWRNSTDIIFITEGEKCVHALFGIGVLATTFPGGSNGWNEDYTVFFQGRRVVILPDNDFTGNAYSVQIHDSLKTIASEINILKLPGLLAREDVVDWLQKGGTKDELLHLANHNLRLPSK